MRALYTLLCLFLCLTQAWAQSGPDTLRRRRLDSLVVKSSPFPSEVSRLPAVQSTFLFSGRKSEVIAVDNLNAAIAQKSARQIFAKVPGVFVYDMDGTGNQMNISLRGLDAHRGWELNTRKNGIITNSDLYGYPASHYSMPMEAIERIELVRGTASLQYGSQFGGMVNYVTKTPDTTRAISYEGTQTLGSFGLMSSYHALGGKIGKFRYYVYANKRVSDGYRRNGSTNYDAESAMLTYTPTRAMSLTAEVARSNYVYRIPGPLTDSMFRADPRQATRSRNYFNPDIYVPSLSWRWQVGPKTLMTWVTSAVLGKRNSVQFDKPATVADGINPATGQYAQRQVDIDQFNSYTSELRVMHAFEVGRVPMVWLAGVQAIRNDLHRQQLGKGTTGTDFDLQLVTPGWGRDLHYRTNNVAVFSELSIRPLAGLTLLPGFRLESGVTDMTGVITYYNANAIPNRIAHQFPLLSFNAEYQMPKGNKVYAGIAQAYRPVIFKDIIPAATYERADKSLRDATGYNLELGYRGRSRNLQWDLGVFRLQYNNRMGTQAGHDLDGTFYLLRTNIGNSTTQGLESYLEYHWSYRRLNLSWFTSTAWFDSRYHQASVRVGEANVDISGNQVESVPGLISRNGMTMNAGRVSVTTLYCYTASSYADPLNTVKPSATGAVGLVPAYGILDVNATIRFSGITVRAGLNNVLDKHYFTKRPAFYPGPGVWSSDGRNATVSVSLRI